MMLETEPVIDHFAKEAFRRFNEAVETRILNIRRFGNAEVEALAELDARVERERRRWERWYRVYCSAHNMTPVQ